MKIEFDPSKSAANEAKRGLGFERTGEFDWGGAVYYEDKRFAYPERRFATLGYIGERLHFICFTPIVGGVRIISFRKANKKEVAYYEQETNHG
jgi:uncharacterized protein